MTAVALAKLIHSSLDALSNHLTSKSVRHCSKLANSSFSGPDGRVKQILSGFSCVMWFMALGLWSQG